MSVRVSHVRLLGPSDEQTYKTLRRRVFVQQFIIEGEIASREEQSGGRLVATERDASEPPVHYYGARHARAKQGGIQN